MKRQKTTLKPQLQKQKTTKQKKKSQIKPDKEDIEDLRENKENKEIIDNQKDKESDSQKKNKTKDSKKGHNNKSQVIPLKTQFFIPQKKEIKEEEGNVSIDSQQDDIIDEDVREYFNQTDYTYSFVFPTIEEKKQVIQVSNINTEVKKVSLVKQIKECLLCKEEEDDEPEEYDEFGKPIRKEKFCIIRQTHTFRVK